MEIADLFVINKADRPGADRLAREVDMMLHLRLGNALKNVPAHHGMRARVKKSTRQGENDKTWAIPVLKTIAETSNGVPELAQTLARHREWLSKSGELAERRRKRLKERVREAVERQLQGIIWREKGGEQILEASVMDLEAGKVSPYAVAARIVAEINHEKT
jgi:LAO/AO transport system kinase